MTLAVAETLDVSVLVPAKDEAANLPDLLRLCAEALTPAGFSFEVVVVDDGSRDESADRKSTRLNSSHIQKSRMPSSA